ncbi:AfsR/SARP family transcriptional regulator [Nocardia sp. NPDC004654]|uniref:AfsR/SARP family transcriptional regulator n=1 Tax=Nocardia sp. NPDC004654 TaxID=3154776 RepID=UPI0033A4AEB9
MDGTVQPIIHREGVIVRYEILGPVRVVDSSGSSFISAPKIELLLSVLLIRSEELIRVDQLKTELWNDNPPRRATAGVHVYISQLRKFIDRPSETNSAIITRPSGYIFRLGDDELDLTEFLQLVEEGRGHARSGAHDAAVSCFDKGLRLWRGTPFDDLSCGPITNRFATWLSEIRLEWTELAIESHLRLGLHRQMISELYSLISEHPLRETFYRQLMLALYLSGRRVDALALYESARSTLIRELGIEPCRSLQGLHHAILVGDDSVDKFDLSSVNIGAA